MNQNFATSVAECSSTFRSNPLEFYGFQVAVRATVGSLRREVTGERMSQPVLNLRFACVTLGW